MSKPNIEIDDEEKHNTPLSVRQMRFIDAYLVDYNGKQAAILAGYSERSAETQASRMLRTHKVMSEINKREADFRQKHKIRKEEMVDFLTEIKNANIKDYIKFDGKKLVFKSFDELTKAQSMAIESIKMGKNGIELKLHGKSWASDQLNKHLGTYEADNSQKGDAAPKVYIGLPDNKRGKVVAIDEIKQKEE